jgi:PAS domain S-box-containing protein
MALADSPIVVPVGAPARARPPLGVARATVPPVQESFFAEMKRYVRFGEEDGEALRALLPTAAPRFPSIAEEFYDRLNEHDEARDVFESPEQVQRLKRTLCAWLELLLSGPWDDAYHEKRARIGRVHVRIGLAQRYMFGAMNLVRISLTRIAQESLSDDDARRETTVRAIAKVIDLELAIMLETYREAFVDKVQELERHERGLLEQRLALSEAQYSNVVDHTWSLLCALDEDGRVVLFNRRCEELTGIARERAVGQSWLALFVPAEQQEAVRRIWDDVLADRRAAPWEGRAPSCHRGECRVRWHFTTLPSGGGGRMLCAHGLDVSEEHELATRTRRAERLASLGTMAAGLAHEIRNPLNAAHLQLKLVQRRLARTAGADIAGASTAAEVVNNEIQRLASLVDEFLQFARPQPLRLARVDLRATAESVVELLGPEAHRSGVDLALAPGAAVPANVDEERIRQVLLNLLRNALEATGAEGQVRVRVEPAADGALLEVADDGPGLPTPDAPIFEPFYTTKPEGTGLGLAIVHRIIADHGGRVSVESRPGRTVFSIFLPTLN